MSIGNFEFPRTLFVVGLLLLAAPARAQGPTPLTGAAFIVGADHVGASPANTAGYQLWIGTTAATLVKVGPMFATAAVLVGQLVTLPVPGQSRGPHAMQLEAIGVGTPAVNTRSPVVLFTVVDPPAAPPPPIGPLTLKLLSAMSATVAPDGTVTLKVPAGTVP